MTRFTSVDEWRAKKQWSDKIEVEGSHPEMKGFVYPDGAWIELEDSGQWHTIVGNTEEFRWDLRSMEDYLWACHSCQNLSTPREIMCDELSDYCDKHNLPHMSADALEVECKIKEGVYAAHAQWLYNYCKRWDALDDEE